MAVPTVHVEKRIIVIRGHRVMLDSDLAELYGVPTKRLNEAVHRNATRFPEDFMFQLTVEENESLRSQIATLKPGRGRYRKYLDEKFEIIFESIRELMELPGTPRRRIGF